MDAEWIDPTASTSASSSEWRDPSVLVPPSVPVSASPSVPVPPSVLVPPSVPELLEGYRRELEDCPELLVDDEGVFNVIDETEQCWEGDEWVGHIPESATCSKEEAELYMSEYLLEKYNSGKWYATDVCKLAYFGKMGGMGGGVAALAKRPGLPTSHYNRHLKKLLGFETGSDVLDSLPLPSSDSGDGSRIEYRQPVIHPHEHLNLEMADDGEELKEKLAAARRDDLLPPVHTNHPIVLKHGTDVQPVVLYLDGVPTTKKDGVLGVWLYFHFSRKRHCCTIIKKSRMCKCGCRGWCTLFVVFAWLNWSFLLMADGEHPSRTWDNCVFEDLLRLGLIGVPLLFKACLVAIKGDWKEVAETFQFSNWMTKLAPCYGCWCTTNNYLQDEGFSSDNTIWPDFTMQDYEEACTSCEVLV